MKNKSQPAKPKSSRSASTQSPPSRAAFRLNQILVTTDFSENSKMALPYAMAFAKGLGGEVILLNIVERPSHLAGLESVVLQSGDEVIGRVYQHLDRLAEQAAMSTVPVKTQVRTGKPFREIINAARELHRGVLIMATHGYTGLKHTFLGSTTERVIRHVSCPVLAVRGNKKFSPGMSQENISIRKVLLSTDFSQNSLKAFPFAQAVADAFNSHITLLNVVERFPIDVMLGEEITRDTSRQLMNEARERLKELSLARLKNCRFKPDTMVRFGTPFAEIVSAAKGMDASLIVVATHGYTGLKHIYLGSVAERIVRHAHCPVLVVPSNRI
jgi:nucleotide-binding universal stress UspA family protein